MGTALAIGLALVALMAYIRFAPSDRAVWHVDPRAALPPVAAGPEVLPGGTGVEPVLLAGGQSRSWCWRGPPQTS
ncbi:MAG: hypothetical protein HC844_13375 [Tabrizicola sp.]|nr:hypothetical protein [Tabrizicola sp.]